MMIQTIETNASGVYAGVCKCKVEEARDWREEGKPVVKGVSFELGPGRRNRARKGSERISNNTPADGAELRKKKQTRKPSKCKKKQRALVHDKIHGAVIVWMVWE